MDSENLFRKSGFRPAKLFRFLPFLVIVVFVFLVIIIFISRFRSTVTDTAKETGYSSSPASYALSTGDTVEVKSTLIPAGQQWFDFKLNRPSADYSIVVYDSPYILSHTKIRKGENYDDYYKINILESSQKKGSLLIYSSDTKIELLKENIKNQPLIEIPFKISD